MRVVDGGTGQERIFPAPHPFGAEVFDFSPAGIYLAAGSEAGEVGLWLLDPQSGTERLVTSEKIVAAVGNGKAWLSQLTSSQVGSTADTLIQLDLATGSKTVWIHRDTPTVNLI
ncbi:MAG TPA: hypothetical protein VGS16_00915 [Candidatus Dormibacteraeota bacterium]|nr:hypothetical protein [Candidatus Dormibacteraeota bacterium]